ncbi:G-type lectin S-receptor-like serine/threonine-protein kinase-like [Dorcoceras hygrometricum]|uniref:Receptor-like serine/threonine-protein kinase n=1 Tax=Dorcoceras hygrometricum TaxID=472368 RepID=A0A2Z7BGB0_9LAMI|nr:G-type lectin S-receptor-like serine/threonine-protein kinase-like [Dorcoceras hygrometricum]
MMITILILVLFAGLTAAADIPLGSTLYASDPNSKWVSSDNTFTFTFFNDPTSATTVAAIAYGNITIWKGGGPSVSVNSSAILRLLQSGDLQLLPSSTSSSPVWSSGTSNLGVVAAALENSGNFVLKNSSGAAVWSTFDHPVDTIVPTQQLNANQTLVSGIYTFKMRENGNLTLTWNKSIEYYNSGLNSTMNSNLTKPVLSILPIGIVTLSDPSLAAPLDLAYASDYAQEGDIFWFLKLDNDGNLRIYSSARGSGTSTVRWAALSDQCQVFGYCGNMGICSYNDSSPVCGCPSQNFDLIDPKDSRKGCKRKLELRDCPGNETMLELDHAKFLTFFPELSSQVFYGGIDPCRQLCLVGPCTVSTSLSDGSGICFLKLSDFVSGYQSPALPSTSFVKVCGPVIPNPAAASASGGTSKTLKVTAWIVVLVVLVTVLGLIVVEGGLWWMFFRNSPRFGGFSAQYTLLEYASGAPVQFSYKELNKATKGFKEKLGAGGFGAVYRGVLANRTVVAVKQLEGIEQGEKQFRMEVATISSTHHLNLVRLIGFCSEGRHRLLVYEFMRNSSLDNFLFTSVEQSGKHLDWEYRYKIALGTAKGITYLHEECRDCIVHCDIKPENILLDENYTAKVSDFGLAKLVNPKDHRYRTLTSVRGTRGYLAPEWLANLPITSKSDVYSYGMVLLEIVSGRRNFDVSEETHHKKFSLWAYEVYEMGNFAEIVDKRLFSHEMDMEQVLRAIEVSFWCIQEQPSQRPMMGKVVQMLEGIVEIDRPPIPKAATEGSIVGQSVTGSGSISGTSTYAAPFPVPSSSSSHQPAGILSPVSGKHGDLASSSLLHSEIK